MEQFLTFDLWATLAGWGRYMAGLFSAATSPFWLPTLLLALVPVIWVLRAEGVAWRDMPRRMVPRDPHLLRAFLRELPVDVGCFLGYSLLMVAVAPVAFLLTALGAGLVLVATGTPPQGQPLPQAWQMAVIALAAFAASDFMLYWSHRLFHRVPLLWRSHKLHHAPPVLTPLTAFRFWPWEHFAHLAGSAVGQGVALGLCIVALNVTATPMFVLGVNIFTLVWAAAFSHLRHSHVPLGFPRWLCFVLVSPHMHQAHHSTDPAHHGRNYATVFSLWDWMFGTLYLPGRGERFRFGLAAEPDLVAATATSPMVSTPGHRP